jgi:hypothetical protein
VAKRLVKAESKSFLWLETKENRRWEKRFRISAPCRCQWEDHSFDARTSDLSKGGACVSAQEMIPPPGEKIRLTLLVGSQYVLNGRVVYRHLGIYDPFLGLAFDGTGDYSDYLDYLSRQ